MTIDLLMAPLRAARACRPAPRRATGAPLLGRLARWFSVMAERRRLAMLDPRLMADIGLEREQALREAARPFWDVTSRR